MNEVIMNFEYYSTLGAAFCSTEFMGDTTRLIVDGTTDEDIGMMI